MILHDKKLIFIHIPKTGGTSIEKLFGVAPFNPSKPDYFNLVGWCPERKIYLQHATPSQLIETGLIDRKIFFEYRKITIERNTFSRLVSDYYWHRNLINNKGSFYKYLLSIKPFRDRNVNSKGTPYDYSSHIRSQLDYIFLDGELVIDDIFSFNEINNIILNLAKNYNLQMPNTLHEKKGNYNSDKKELYNYFLKILVKIKYYKEIKYFNYKF